MFGQSTDEGPRRPVHPALWAVAGFMVAVEVVFAAVEAGLLPDTFARYRVYFVFAFWDPLFDHAVETGTPPLQLAWSFLTHALLHGGWLHLGLNTAAFLALGHAVSQMAGIRACLVTTAVSAIAGGLAFGLIAEVDVPLVGASGAIFGLLATLTAWQEQALRRAGLPRTDVWNRIMGLILINLLLDLGLGGMLAWEAHLGGFVGGWLMAYVYPPRLMRPASP